MLHRCDSRLHPQLDYLPISQQVSAASPLQIVAGVLPTAIVFCHCRCLKKTLYICLHHFSRLISFLLPTLLESSLSPPVLPQRKGLGVVVGCAFGFVVAFVLLFGIVSVLLFAKDSFTASDYGCFRISDALFACCWLCSYLACCWLCSCLACCWLLSAFLVLFISPCCLACFPRGIGVASCLLLTSSSLAVILSLNPPASLCGRFPASWVPRLAPPTPPRGNLPLRDRLFAIYAPWSCSLQQHVLLTMRIGSSFARNFSFTCSAELYVPLFTGCVHNHEVKIYIVRLGTTVCLSVWSVGCFATAVPFWSPTPLCGLRHDVISWVVRHRWEVIDRRVFSQLIQVLSCSHAAA